MSDDSTVVITNIFEELNKSEKEANDKPACLVVVGGDLNGTIFDLEPNITSVGRSPECTISVDFRGISRKHFQIELKNSIATVTDLGSSNGTYVNNIKLDAPKNISKGDMIKIGGAAFKYIPEGDPERLTYDKLHLEANTDGLTSCFNKTYFNNSLAALFRKAQTRNIDLSLIVFDLDHFKNLNDTYGHDAGDYVLKELAGIIRNNGVRDEDVFARYGGEEFVILLPETKLKQAIEIAERLRILIEQHQFMYEAKRLPVTASIGVADYVSNMSNSTELFKRADSAVYTSKNGGRNQVSSYK